MEENLFDRAGFGNPPVADDGDLIADFLDHAHFVRDDDGGDPQTPVDILDQRKDGFRSGGVEGGSGLVAQEDLGVGSQSAGDGHCLLYTSRCV